MKSVGSLQVFLLLLALVKVHSQDTVFIECRFSQFTDEIYWCQVNGIEFSHDDPSQNFAFIGNHLESRSNLDVTHVTILDSQVPFVITQIFETFPNLIRVDFSRGGLRRIQSNAVVDARRLVVFSVLSNANLTEVHSNAFAGATNLDQLNLNGNSIDTVHEKAFVGLQRVRVINLSNNFISRLPENVFRPARRLDTVFLRENQITTIHASIFAHNNIMHQIELQGNGITAIDRRFFTPIRELFWLSLLRNECISRNFSRGNAGIIGEALSVCFENYDRMTNDANL